jgi:hypothetical protein
VPFEIEPESATNEAVAERTTCCVELLSEPSQAQQGATKRAREPSGVDGDLLKVIRRAVNESGELGIAGADAPAGARAVPVETVKTYCQTMAWQDDKEGAAFRAVFSRSLSQLRAKDLIGRNRRAVWLTA